MMSNVHESAIANYLLLTNSPFVSIFIDCSEKIRFSAIFPKINILRYMLLHTLYINMAIGIRYILAYRNSLYDLPGTKYKNESDREPFKMGVAKKGVAVRYKIGNKSGV